MSVYEIEPCRDDVPAWQRTWFLACVVGTGRAVGAFGRRSSERARAHDLFDLENTGVSALSDKDSVVAVLPRRTSEIYSTFLMRRDRLSDWD